jgi:hypothetical protein
MLARALHRSKHLVLRNMRRNGAPARSGPQQGAASVETPHPIHRQSLWPIEGKCATFAFYRVGRPAAAAFRSSVAENAAAIRLNI